MTNPTAQYRIKYDGQYLPGYVQSEEVPLNQRNVLVDVINRDGGTWYDNGLAWRQISWNFRVLSRLDNNSTGIEHLGDTLEQYREALRISSRALSASTLFIGDTDHYLVGRFNGATNPLSAPDSKAINYSLTFDVTPVFYGPEITESQSISGDDTVVLNIGDTRKTYPVFDIPGGITGITVSHTASGKSFTISGTPAAGLYVDCGNLTVKNKNTGNTRFDLLTSGPDFGMYQVGSGSFTADITGVTGSGNFKIRMKPRLER